MGFSLGGILKVAAPIVGAMVAGPVGAAVGGGLAGASGGGGLQGTAIGAGLGYAGASLAGGASSLGGTGAYVAPETYGGFSTEGGLAGEGLATSSAGTWYPDSYGGFFTAGGIAGEGLPGFSSGASAFGTPVSDRSFNYTGTGYNPAGNSLLSSIKYGPQVMMSQLGLGTPLGASAGAMPWGSASNLLTMGSGIYGLMQAEELKRKAAAMSSSADPFGPYRGYYGAEMQKLQADPSRMTSLPGYEAGLEAVQRSMAAQGYTGSGNMMAALQKYGGDFYNQTMNQYATYAGAGFNPAAAGQLSLTGQGMSADLASRSLASLGYGTYMAR